MRVSLEHIRLCRTTIVNWWGIATMCQTSESDLSKYMLVLVKLLSTFVKPLCLTKMDAFNARQKLSNSSCESATWRKWDSKHIPGVIFRWHDYSIWIGKWFDLKLILIRKIVYSTNWKYFRMTGTVVDLLWKNAWNIFKLFNEIKNLPMDLISSMNC